MSKRFLDTSIWERQWFMDLEANEKLAMVYLFSRCDAVGVWCPNYKLANFHLGIEIDWPALIEKCNGNVEIQKSGKWWLPDFCDFQYGELTTACPPHRKYISLLRKFGLLERVMKGYTKGSHTLQEEEEEEEVNLKSKEPKPFFNTSILKWENITDEAVALWEKAYPACDIERELTKMATWILANPKKGKKSNYSRFITNWLSRAQDNGGTK